MSEGIFLGFFFRLRSQGLPVSPTEWLTLVEGLCRGLHGSSMIGFYSLARSVLIKDEARLDAFDQAFAEQFKGVAHVAKIEEEVWRWLETALERYPIDPALLKMLEQVDVEALRELFEQRLREQTERHDGGNKWIGTGGTSPFGHSGYHPGGIRVGGEGHLGSAVKVAAARRYREHRQDLVLDTRQLSVALKKLRALKRVGQAEELDLDNTIDRSAKSAGELELVFRPPRRNQLTMLLAMDVGGSMEPYRHLVDILFSAAHASKHFKRLSHIYFHNCIYDRVYLNASFSETMPTSELLAKTDRDTRLVLVGDAYMAPSELSMRNGAIDWNDQNEIPGIVWLKRISDHFRYKAWLNPMSQRYWNASSTSTIRKVFQMLPLTVEGVESLATELSRGGMRRHG